MSEEAALFVPQAYILWMLGIIVTAIIGIVGWLVRDARFKQRSENFDETTKELIEKLQNNLCELQERYGKLEEKFYLHMIAMEGLLEKVRHLQDAERIRSEEERRERREKK